MVVTIEPSAEFMDGIPRGKSSCRTVELHWGTHGLAGYVDQRPQCWKRRWEQVVSKLESGKLRFEVLQASRDLETLQEQINFLDDMYRLRFRLTRSRPSSGGDCGVDLPSFWPQIARQWNHDGTLRWVLTFDGSTPMSIELIREVGNRWECHCSGFDLGVQEPDPVFSSLAMVFISAELEQISRVVMCEATREIDPFDWGFVRSTDSEILG
jgi:hypothetical protein